MAKTHQLPRKSGNRAARKRAERQPSGYYVGCEAPLRGKTVPNTGRPKGAKGSKKG